MKDTGAEHDGFVVESKKRNKDKTITFRLTSELYEQLDDTAKLNKLNLSELIQTMLEDHFQEIDREYAMAKFLNGLSKEAKQYLLTHEQQLIPPSFRVLNNAIEKYPHAKSLKEELEERGFGEKYQELLEEAKRRKSEMR